MSQEKPSGKLEFRSEPKAHAYTDGDPVAPVVPGTTGPF